MTPENLKKAATANKQITLDEAYKILGADSNAGIEEVMKVQCAASITESNGSVALAQALGMH